MRTKYVMDNKAKADKNNNQFIWKSSKSIFQHLSSRWVVSGCHLRLYNVTTQSSSINVNIDSSKYFCFAPKSILFQLHMENCFRATKSERAKKRKSQRANTRNTVMYLLFFFFFFYFSAQRVFRFSPAFLSPSPFLSLPFSLQTKPEKANSSSVTYKRMAWQSEYTCIQLIEFTDCVRTLQTVNFRKISGESYRRECEKKV